MEKNELGYTAKLREKTHAAVLRRVVDLSRSEYVADDILQRYFGLVEQSTKELCALFTHGELSLQIEACGPHIPTQAIPDMLSKDVRFNAKEEGRAAAWGVDTESFFTKLDRLPTVAWFALADLSARVFAEGGDLDTVLDAHGYKTRGGVGSHRPILALVK